MSLSERRKDDVPFIGSDDIYYETESGKVFDETKQVNYTSFEEWYGEGVSYSLRSEWIQGDVKAKDPEMLKHYLKEAFEAGKRSVTEQIYDLMRHTIMD